MDKSKTITQANRHHTITVCQDRTPVIASCHEWLIEDTAMAVNFIMAGTRGAQITLLGNTSSNFDMMQRVASHLEDLVRNGNAHPHPREFNVKSDPETGIMLIT